MYILFICSFISILGITRVKMKVFRHLNDDLYQGSVLMPLFLEMYTGVIGIKKTKYFYLGWQFWIRNNIRLVVKFTSHK